MGCYDVLWGSLLPFKDVWFLSSLNHWCAPKNQQHGNMFLPLKKNKHQPQGQYMLAANTKHFELENKSRMFCQYLVHEPHIFAHLFAIMIQSGEINIRDWELRWTEINQDELRWPKTTKMKPFLFFVASFPLIASISWGPSRHLVHIGQANLQFFKDFVQDKHGDEGASWQNQIT